MSPHQRGNAKYTPQAFYMHGHYINISYLDISQNIMYLNIVSILLDFEFSTFVIFRSLMRMWEASQAILIIIIEQETQP